MELLAGFVDRLSELVFDSGLKWNEFAEKVGVSKTTAYRWKLSPHQMKLDSILTVADFFRCTIEFLIGRSNDDIDFEPQKCPKFSENLRRIMAEKRISTYQLRKISKYDGKYFEVWDRGAEPLLSTLLELSDIFGCTIDYLVGREN